MKNILLTDGLGFIGSHVASVLGNNKDLNIVILDNLFNSDIQVLDKIKSLVKFPENLNFVKVY